MFTRWIALLVACSLGLALAHAQAPSVSLKAEYVRRLQEARALAAEQSWAKAKDAYAEALKFASDDEDRRWCELGMADADWRSNAKGGDWTRRNDAFARAREVLNRLIEPIDKSTSSSLNDFAIAALESRGALSIEAYDHSAGWKDWMRIARSLATREPSTEAERRYVKFLVDHVPPHLTQIPLDSGVEQLLTDSAQPGGTLSAEDRAWCLVVAALLGESRREAPEAQLECWARVDTATRGTRWEPLARAELFLHQVQDGRDPAQGPNAPADLPKRISEAQERERALREAALGGLSQASLQRLASYIEVWTQPVLILRAPSSVGTKQKFAFSYAAASLKAVTAEIVRFPFESASVRGYEQNEFKRAGIVPNDPRQYGNWSEGGEPVRTIKLNTAAAESHAWHSEVVELPDVLPPGFYALALRGEGERTLLTVARFVITDLRARYFFVSDHTGRLYVSSSEGDGPLVGAKIEGRFKEQDSAPWSSQTDHDGFAQIPAPKHGRAVLYARVNGQPIAVTAFGFGQENEPAAPLVVDAIFDRQLYRPGETVHWKIVARERLNGGFAQTRRKLRLNVGLGETVLLVDHPLKFNEFGAAQGEIVLPSTLRSGAARLQVSETAGGRGSESVLDAFYVDRANPPVTQLNVEWLAPKPPARGPIGVRARASYFSGEPISGAKIVFQVQMSPMMRTFHRERISSDAQDQTMKRSAVSTTNADGVAEFMFDSPSETLGQVSVNAEVEFTPEGGSAVRKTLSGGMKPWPVTFASAVGSTFAWAPSGEPFRQAVLLQDRFGRPMAYEGTAKLVRLTWTEVWVNDLGEVATATEAARRREELRLDPEADLPAPWRLLERGYRETEAATVRLQAGNDGRAIGTSNPLPDGVYSLRATEEKADAYPEISDSYEASGARPLWIVAGDQTADLPLRPSAALALTQGPWRSGQTEQLLVVFPKNSRSATLLVSGESEVMTRRLSAAGRVQVVTIKRVPQLAGEANVQFIPSGCESAPGSIRVTADNPGLNLQVKIEPDAATVRPGEKRNVRVRVMDNQGRPAKAELAIGVVDQALESLVARENGDSGTEFSRFRRSLYAMAVPPEEVEPIAVIRDTRPGAVLNAGESRQISDMVELNQFVVQTGMTSRGYSVAAAAGESRKAGIMLADKAEPAIVVRRNFSSTAFWDANVRTNSNGEAGVAFTYPESLTEWRLHGYAVGASGGQFGRGEARTRTTLPFQARLQAPRTLVAGDRVDVAATLINRTDQPVMARAELAASGAIMLVADAGRSASVTTPAQGESRTYWSLAPAKVGEGKLTLTARGGDALSDGMELIIPTREDGIQQEFGATTRLKPSDPAGVVSLQLPDPYDPTRTQAWAQVSSSYAATLFDALPYLIDYPYGCIEQTMSRFLPAVAVKSALTQSGFDAAAVEKRIMARETPADAERREKTAGIGRLDDVVSQSLQRLAAGKRADGSFGWWPGSPQSDTWMTAYVVWGLTLARDNAGVRLPAGLLTEAERALETLVVREPEAVSDASAFALAALAMQPDWQGKKLLDTTFAAHFAARDRLSPTGRACLLLAAPKFGAPEQQQILLRNLENGAARAASDNLGDTVRWGATENYFWATQDAVETTALTLMALLETQPNHPLTEPAANWLVLNRRSAHWKSTRSTAFAVLALTRYLQSRKEFDPSGAAEVWLNGQRVQTVTLDRAALLKGPQAIPLDPSRLKAGENRVEVRRKDGNTAIYMIVTASSWARGESVKPAGYQAEVARAYTRLKMTPTVIGTLNRTAQPLGPVGTSRAGEQVVATLDLQFPNDLEYVMIEVPKPAGCEPLNPLSGWDARLIPVGHEGAARSPIPLVAENVASEEEPADEDGADIPRGEAIYREEHDDKSVFFLTRVSAGKWQLKYHLRATIAGDYRALPAQLEAMYVPEIRANSDARRLVIER